MRNPGHAPSHPSRGGAPAPTPQEIDSDKRLRRTNSESDALLSDALGAFLSKVPESGRNFQIIIMREAQLPGTRPGNETKARWCLPFDKELRFPRASLVTRASFLLKNALPTGLRLKLHLPRGVQPVVLSNSDLDRMTRSDFMRPFPDNQSWERFSVSQPGFNFSKTKALLYVNHYCAGLCGGGGYILMPKVDGVWRIVDEHITWMS